MERGCGEGSTFGLPQGRLPRGSFPPKGEGRRVSLPWGSQKVTLWWGVERKGQLGSKVLRSVGRRREMLPGFEGLDLCGGSPLERRCARHGKQLRGCWSLSNVGGLVRPVQNQHRDPQLKAGPHVLSVEHGPRITGRLQACLHTIQRQQELPGGRGTACTPCRGHSQEVETWRMAWICPHQLFHPLPGRLARYREPAAQLAPAAPPWRACRCFWRGPPCLVV